MGGSNFVKCVSVCVCICLYGCLCVHLWCVDMWKKMSMVVGAYAKKHGSVSESMVTCMWVDTCVIKH